MKPQQSWLPRARGAVLVLGAFVILAVSNGSGRVTQVLAAVPLTDADIEDRLEAQGFTGIKDLHHEGTRVVVTATRWGHTDQFVIDPMSGDPVQSKDDDDDDDD